MKALSLLSGGKDSFLAAQFATEQGFEVDTALTVIPQEFSLMYHYPNAQKASLVASLAGMNWISVEENSLGDEIRKFANAGYQALVSGAIASEYQKTRLEEMCSSAGIISYTPLWHKDQKMILEELILRNIGAMIVSVSAEGFTEADLGRVIDQEFIHDLENRNEKYGINLAGEGGEYESFVFSSGGRSVRILSSRRIWQGSHGYLLIDKAEIV